MNIEGKKFGFFITQYFVLKKRNADLLRALEEIAKVAKDYDNGARQYTMTDWEYVAKQCEKVLK